MIGIMSFIVNIAVVSQTYTAKSLAVIPNFLIRNLAISDFLMSLYLLIIAVNDLIYSDGRYGIKSEQWLTSPFCILACVLVIISNLTSVLFMVVISIDRYNCIVHPFSTKNLQLRQFKFLTGTIWVTSIIFCFIPIALGIGRSGSERIYRYSSICLPNNYDVLSYKIWMLFYLITTVVA